MQQANVRTDIALTAFNDDGRLEKLSIFLILCNFSR